MMVRQPEGKQGFAKQKYLEIRHLGDTTGVGVNEPGWHSFGAERPLMWSGSRGGRSSQQRSSAASGPPNKEKQ